MKETHVHNDLAEVLGLERRALSLVGLPTSKWMTRVAAGDAPLNEEEQDVLYVGDHRDIDVVYLEQLIAS